MKYDTFIRILDQIRKEAPESMRATYRPAEDKVEELNYARSRAYIHLYLKVAFGLVDFEERERYVTDGKYDGGIDGYFINSDNRVVYFIQAKFRANEKNFEAKKIELEEILVMDINRILDGDTSDEMGNKYNGKILQMQRDISANPDIARYSNKVVILANLEPLAPAKARQLTGGISLEVISHVNCYERLVFPVISGTFFNASELKISLDLSNKNAGSKISYTVSTRISECEITVLFVPTIEIAKLMMRYKNSILKYNPRSYLEMDGRTVHEAIRETITSGTTNEFALYNNGITILSDETFINEKIGMKNRAQLSVKNPQIINGGQTSYTLSRILQELPNPAAESIFDGKEVLLKVITFRNTESEAQRLQLIDEISNATNQQTPVLNADKFSNEETQIRLQHKLFENFGLLYERKRGEFSDGVNSGYVDQKQILERNHFLRIYFAANGNLASVVKRRLFQSTDITEKMIDDTPKLGRAVHALRVFTFLSPQKNGRIVPRGIEYIQTYVFSMIHLDSYVRIGTDGLAEDIRKFKSEWPGFLASLDEKGKVKKRARYNSKTGELRFVERNRGIKMSPEDIQAYFGKQ